MLDGACNASLGTDPRSGWVPSGAFRGLLRMGLCKRYGINNVHCVRIIHDRHLITRETHQHHTNSMHLIQNTVNHSTTRPGHPLDSLDEGRQVGQTGYIHPNSQHHFPIQLLNSTPTWMDTTYRTLCGPCCAPPRSMRTPTGTDCFSSCSTTLRPSTSRPCSRFCSSNSKARLRSSSSCCLRSGVKYHSRGNLIGFLNS